jgi:hypothetical protein
VLLEKGVNLDIGWSTLDIGTQGHVAALAGCLSSEAWSSAIDATVQKHPLELLAAVLEAKAYTSSQNDATLAQRGLYTVSKGSAGSKAQPAKYE